jgi:hypothetical protein
MLRYDPAWLLECYRDERSARPGLPYVELDACGPSKSEFRIVRMAEPFRLNAVLEIEPRLAYDEQVARLADYDSTTRTLHIQKCAYSDGVKSNFAMERLRGLFQAEYGYRLPPLPDARLSNGIGTAVVVFTAAGPYLPRRSGGQAVFPTGYHCTASGETLWNDGADSFDEIFTSNICRELEEEVGLTRADLEWIRPVAFCREFLRGGKPQFFFAGYTALGAEELGRRRRAAIAQQRARGAQEVEDEVAGAHDLEACTMEAVANLEFAKSPWRGGIAPDPKATGR